MVLAICMLSHSLLSFPVRNLARILCCLLQLHLLSWGALFLMKLLVLPLTLLFPAKLRVEEVTVRIPNLQVDSIRIVHLTDFHWDLWPVRNNDALMTRVVNDTNALQPDLILLTGDF